MVPAIALTIGGSDSGGGAGIQADLKTFLALRVYGCSAITCDTAENTCGVSRVDALPPDALTAQIAAVLGDLPVAALKTGMLLNRSLIEATVERVAEHLLQRGPQAVLIKGGGWSELRGRDYLLQRHAAGQWLEHAVVETPHSHGSGCTLAAAITAERARGVPLLEAVWAAKTFVQHGLRKGLAIGAGQGPPCHWHPLL